MGIATFSSYGRKEGTLPQHQLYSKDEGTEQLGLTLVALR
jgi:hypothetical protein